MFDGSYRRVRVADLISAGVLRVEDGNHGEYRPRREEFSAEGTAFIRAADMSASGIAFATAEKINDTALARVRKGIGAPNDTILSHKGTVGRVAYAPFDSPPFVCSPQTTFWRSLDHTQVHPRFLFYELQSDSFQAQLIALQGESDMAPYVSLTEQRKLWLQRPPVRTQKAIAAVLGALDDKVAVNERIMVTQAQLISALFACAVREPGCTQVLATEVFDFDFGLPFASSHFNSDGRGMPLLRIRDLRTFTPQVFTTQRLANDVIVAPGDVVAGMDAEFRPTIWLGEPTLLNQRVLRCRSRVGGGNSFVVEALRQPLLEIENSKTGTTVIHLNKADLDRAKVALPSPSALHVFETKSEPLRLSIVDRARETKTLAELRGALLPGLMSGAIRVRHAESVVEAMT